MRVVFGECEFDSGRRVLLRHGSLTPLSPKAFQLLELLLDRRPEAVAKTELLERLWPGTFVSDASLHNLVAEIRAALGDAPRAARYIRTVPRYGYAFHGDARLAPAADISRSANAGPRLVSGRREWLLSAGANLVGRDRDCVVRIDSATLSRHHARIIVTSRETTVEDLGSKNGTQVNGQRVTQRVALKDSDQIQVGSVTMTYRILDTLPSTVTRRGVQRP
jgi:DNA-binding winged helix-turn-helix (wHTH) protein